MDMMLVEMYMILVILGLLTISFCISYIVILNINQKNEKLLLIKKYRNISLSLLIVNICFKIRYFIFSIADGGHSHYNRSLLWEDVEARQNCMICKLRNLSSWSELPCDLLLIVTFLLAISFLRKYEKKSENILCILNICIIVILLAKVAIFPVDMLG